MTYSKEKLIQELSVWGYRVYHPDTFTQVSAATEFTDQLVFIGINMSFLRQPEHVVVAHLYCALDQLVLTVFPHRPDDHHFEKLVQRLTANIAPSSLISSKAAYHRKIDPHWQP